MTRILIVDDEKDFREMLDLYLRREGFETTIAEDVSGFLEIINEFEPDLITLDVLMPGTTTQKILAALKKKKNKSKIILLNTVRYSEKEKRIMQESGNVVDCITQPFDIDEFKDKILKNLNK
ncbi:MAG TPA: hypothetical protein DSN98_02030 [Thermoplasmata archaeon]|nr:MAG TPA: hypothetical protein DSN98_02030 [Thermoplasmata archaeon]